MLVKAHAAPSGHLLQLPHDVIARIALLLSPVDVEKAACTCKTLQRVMTDEALWQKLASRDLPKETAPSCWLQQQGHDGGQWPPSTYRCLLRSLQPFLMLGGLWKASSTERHATTTDNILAFKWAPAALVCLQLKAADSSGEELHWTVVSILSARTVLPDVEQLAQGIIAILPGKPKESEARVGDRERMHAALGASTHPLPGTSPSGSFESELLTFMRNTPPRDARTTRRSKRRRSNPAAGGLGWPCCMHLRSAATPGQHGLRSLSALWVVCARDDSSTAEFVEMTVQVGPTGARLRGAVVGGQPAAALFDATTLYSLSNTGRSSQFWQQHETEIEDALRYAFSDSALSAEGLTSWYTAPGGVETSNWNEVVERLGLQQASRSGEQCWRVSPESSMEEADVDIAGLTHNMSLDGDLSEAQWHVARVLACERAAVDSVPVSRVVEVMLHSSTAHRVVVLLGPNRTYQIMQQIELP